MAQDQDALDELRALSKPGQIHVFIHYLYFPQERSAKHVASILASRGFDVEDRLGADDINWLVLAKKEMTASEIEVANTRAFLEQIAADNDGEYDGWEAAVN